MNSNNRMSAAVTETMVVVNEKQIRPFVLEFCYQFNFVSHGILTDLFQFSPSLF